MGVDLSLSGWLAANGVDWFLTSGVCRLCRSVSGVVSRLHLAQRARGSQVCEAVCVHSSNERGVLRALTAPRRGMARNRNVSCRHDVTRTRMPLPHATQCIKPNPTPAPNLNPRRGPASEEERRVHSSMDFRGLVQGV